MRTRRRTRSKAITRTTVALLGLGLAAGCGRSAPATPAAAPSSAAASAQFLLSAAQSALRDDHGAVHIESSIVSQDGTLTTDSADETAAGGRQAFTYNHHLHMTILVTGKVGYIKADQAVMEGFFHVPEPQAGEFSDEWISVRPGQKLGDLSYSVIVKQTLSSYADVFAVSGDLTLIQPTVVDGQRVVGVQAPVPRASGVPASAKQTLYVTDDTLFRPVLFTWEKYGGVQSWMAFSDWNEKVRLTAPANAVPASAVTLGSATT